MIKQKSEPSKKVTQNLVRESLENITNLLNIRCLQPKQDSHQISINKFCYVILQFLVTIAQGHRSWVGGGGHGATATASHVLN